jgi:hypothetical protein
MASSLIRRSLFKQSLLTNVKISLLKLIFFSYLLSAFATQAPLGSYGFYFNHSIMNLLCSISLGIKELDIISYPKEQLEISDYKY